MIELLTHLAWLTVLVLAWSWAIAQGRYANREPHWWPVPWRGKVTLWLTAKALLFTYLAIVLWDDMTAMPHALVVWLFAAVHAWVFWAWLHLPDGEVVPTRDPPAPPRDRKIYWFH